MDKLGFFIIAVNNSFLFNDRFVTTEFLSDEDSSIWCLIILFEKKMNNFAVTEVRLVCITNDFLCMGNKKTHTQITATESSRSKTRSP